MFAKIFSQILDSSLADDYLTRLVFEDMLKLCDLNGVVDMTTESISRRTNVPLEIVRRGIVALEQPDKRSRTPDYEGRRIIRIDDHRDWGWMIVNYAHYRKIASEEQRREKTLARVHEHRERRKSLETNKTEPAATNCNALKRTETQSNDCNAMQREKDKEMNKEIPPTPQGGSGVGDGSPAAGSKVPTNPQAIRVGRILGRQETTPWSAKEIKAFRNIRPLDESDVAIIEEYYAANRRKEGNICRRDLLTLLNNWQGENDRARAWKHSPRAAATSSRNQATPMEQRKYTETKL